MTWILLLNDMRHRGETVTPVARGESREALDAWEKSLRVTAYRDGEWVRTYPSGSRLEWCNAPLVDGVFMDVGTEESTLQRAIESAKRSWQDVLAIPETPPVIRALLFLVLTSAGAVEVAYPAPMRGRWVEVVLTAYSPLDAFTRNDEGNPRRLTATGVPTGRVPYGVAADPRALPYGTKIWIPPETGYLPETFPTDRAFTVDDTGAIPKRRTRESGVIHLDLRYKSVWSAQQFGTKKTWVFIIEDGV